MVTIINKAFVNLNNLSSTRQVLRAANGCNILTYGEKVINLSVDGNVYPWKCIVADVTVDGLLGADFLAFYNAILDCSSFTIQLSNATPSNIYCLSTNTDKISDQSDELILDLLKNKFPNVFSGSVFIPGRASHVTHHIDTGSSAPIRQNPYRIPIAKQNEIHQHVEEMEAKGIIEQSNSAWSSPVVLVPKKDGTKRFCVDYRRLNKVTRKDAHPLPHMHDVLHSFHNASIFCSLDLKSGYWQVPMAEADKEKTAFVVPGKGLWQFTVMPFGLSNAVATFQRLMERVLSPFLGKGVLVYVDDVLVFSDSKENLYNLLCDVLNALQNAGLVLNESKCKWFQSSISFLGHIVSSNGLQQDPEKVNSVKNWPVPNCKRNIRSFLGLASYYRRFIPNFAKIAKPLHYLTSEHVEFNWTSEANDAFIALKDTLTSSDLVLAYPNVSQSFLLDVDASSEGIGAVLSQRFGDQEKVVEYYSRTLTDSEKNYCATRLELLGLISSLKHFHHYLCGNKCFVRTDHAALLWLRGFNRVEGQLARWMEAMQNYDIEICYRKGKIHQNADSLSRRKCGKTCSKCSKLEIAEVHAINLENEDAINWKDLQTSDKDISELKHWISAEERPEWNCVSGGSPDLRSYWTQFNSFHIANDVVFRKITINSESCTQIVVPPPVRSQVLKFTHGAKFHPGVTRTNEIVRNRFYWPGWRRDVYQHIMSCIDCQSVNGNKGKRKQPHRKFLSGSPWQRVQVDFFGPLPQSTRGNRYVLVFMDQFSKWVECFAVPDSTAETATRYLAEEVVCRYGVPHELHSDQGRAFISRVLHSLCSILGIYKTQTTPYHPESDGQVERFMQFLGSNLAKLTAADQKNWDEMVPWVAFAYRSTVHAVTGFSPAEVFLGRASRLPVDLVINKGYLNGESSSNLLDFQRRIEAVWSSVRDKLTDSVNNRPKYEGRAPPATRLLEGDKVLVFDPGRRVGKCPKLQRKWKGPGAVLERLNDWTYLIKLGSKKLIRHRNFLSKFV